MKTITPEQFSDAVMDALAQYGDHVTDVCQKESKAVSRRAVKELKASAPTGGAYAKGWSHKAEKGRVGTICGEVVYNRLYQLTHLLEKPHTTGGGGHYPKNVDYTGTMARIEEKYTQEYMEGVTNKLGQEKKSRT